MPNLQAYEHYLKALYDASRRTPESMAGAKGHLERAIALDPRFAAAHAQLGNLYGLLGGYGVMSPRDALPLMREEARKALAIDPLLPEGHAMLGTVAAWFDFDWPEAERHFRFAMAQGAVPPLVRLNYAMYCLLPTGRAQEAADHYAIALKEDPLNLMARAERAVCLAIGVASMPRGTRSCARFSSSTRRFSFPTSCLAAIWLRTARWTRHAGWPRRVLRLRHGSSRWSACLRPY